MVTNQTQVEERQRLAAMDFQNKGRFNFDAWAVAVRQQMLASLKKRESKRSNWD
ncbi:MAG: hypothetical protein KME07_03140 [Pegethrix bostrychoides GSE-TBD4-15B]|jgi:hypothetical protein|uniref:Uncharacterized protein n=1 Tax=Pegethrix bostrychoides GSE-TBD4-15B TaxID=2839662 RepID=A0A951P781_9CYAN|nr:hypothetical protein [Pegethrix bostrychoides GSE-TBD4-15B]